MTSTKLVEANEFPYLSTKTDSFFIPRKSTVALLASRGIALQRGDYFNMINIAFDGSLIASERSTIASERSTVASDSNVWKSHIKIELRRSEARYKVIECTTQQLPLIRDYPFVKCIILHTDGINQPDLSSETVDLFIVMGPIDLTRINQTRATVLCSEVDPDLELAPNIKVGVKETKECMDLYRRIGEGKLYCEHLSAANTSLLNPRIAILNTNDINLPRRTFTNNSITVMHLINGKCVIKQDLGLYIIYGKAKPGEHESMVEFGIDRKHTINPSNFAIFFADMTTTEVRSISANHLFYGSDYKWSQESECPNVLKQYLDCNVLLELAGDDFSSDSAFDQTAALIDNPLRYARIDGPMRANSDFESMMIKSNFFINIPLSVTQVRNYKYMDDRKHLLAKNFYVPKPYISDSIAIDSVMQARYERFLAGNGYSERELLITRILKEPNVDTTAFVTALKRNYNLRDDIRISDIFKLGEGTHMADVIAINVTTPVHIKNGIVVYIHTNADHNHNIYIEDCVSVFIDGDGSNKIFIVSNVQTIVDIGESTTVIFDNFSPIKNVASTLLSARGSVTDHFSDYVARSFDELRNGQPRNYDSSESLSYSVEPTPYKSAVSNFFYRSGKQLDPSYRIAEIDHHAPVQ